MQRHQSCAFGAVLVLVVSINLALQRMTVTHACPPTQFECASGGCINLTNVCDSFGNCLNNSDEENCAFSPVDYTKALVVVFSNDELNQGVVITLFGDPAKYAPRLGLRPFYPLTNLSLPITFRALRQYRNDMSVVVDVDSSNSSVLFATKYIDTVSLMPNSTTYTYTYHNFNPSESSSDQFAAVAYDWISKNVYWLDAGYQWIKVAYIGPKAKKQFIYARTVVKNIVNPRDIAVDPINAILFWISGTCGSAQIMRSRLNGSDPTPLALTSTPSSNCPTKLAADVNAQLLYWLDAFNTRVGYVAYSSSPAATNWFTSADFGAMTSMTLFGNYVVLGSKERRTVNFYRKGTMILEGLTALLYSPALDYQLMDIATYDITNQPTSGSSSPCLTNNGGCSARCFSTSRTTSNCDCESWQTLSSVDGTSCIGSSPATNNANCIAICAAAVLAYLLMNQL